MPQKKRKSSLRLVEPPSKRTQSEERAAQLLKTLFDAVERTDLPDEEFRELCRRIEEENRNS